MNRPFSLIAMAVVCLVVMGAPSASGEDSPPATRPGRYTATVTFQVLPPAQGPGQAGAGSGGALQQDEINRFIRRQIYFLRSDGIVQRVLDSDELQHDPRDPTKKSRWIIENIHQLKKRLLEDIEVSPVSDTDLFAIKFTTSDAVEAACIVNGISRVYLDSLRNDQLINQRHRVEDLGKCVEQQENVVTRLEGDLSDFCKANNVDLISSRSQIDVSVLNQVELDYVKAALKAMPAKGQLDALTMQVKTGTLELSPEAERTIETDPRLCMLEQAKLQLDMDQAALPDNAPADAAGAIKRRLDVVTKQLAERRVVLEAAAKVHMQEQAVAEYSRAAAEMQLLKEMRDRKNSEVKDMESLLVMALRKGDRLKDEKAILTSLHEQFTLESLRPSVDNIQVRRLGDAAVPPE